MRTFEYGSNLIHVHAYKSVLDGWALDVVAVIESRGGGPTVARSVTPGDQRFASFDDAIAAGKRMALEFIERAAG
ncbi:MAG: hypothetical protein D6815_06315 [Candidatus Dadabacteria bacterium]|nr:MAG: hypothetical protein D6815_06315 [Candidatus Dadabacteria bacterium]